MGERIERVATVEQLTVIAGAMNSRLENLLELGAETAKGGVCVDCTHLALCGLAISTLRSRKAGVDISTLGEVDVYGVKIDKNAENICPRGLVDEALRRNQTNDFWLLEADELKNTTLDVRAAQTIQLAAEHVRQVIGNKIIK